MSAYRVLIRTCCKNITDLENSLALIRRWSPRITPQYPGKRYLSTYRILFIDKKDRSSKNTSPCTSERYISTCRIAYSDKKSKKDRNDGIEPELKTAAKVIGESVPQSETIESDLLNLLRKQKESTNQRKDEATPTPSGNLGELLGSMKAATPSLRKEFKKENRRKPTSINEGRRKSDFNDPGEFIGSLFDQEYRESRWADNENQGKVMGHVSDQGRPKGPISRDEVDRKLMRPAGLVPSNPDFGIIVNSTFSDEVLQNRFKKYGVIKKIEVLYKHRNRFRDCFVEFEDRKSVEDAIADLKCGLVQGLKAVLSEDNKFVEANLAPVISKGQPKGSLGRFNPNFGIIVNSPFTDEDLKIKFEKYGVIKKIEEFNKHSSNFRDCFVEFEDRKSVENASLELKDGLISGLQARIPRDGFILAGVIHSEQGRSTPPLRVLPRNFKLYGGERLGIFPSVEDQQRKVSQKDEAGSESTESGTATESVQEEYDWKSCWDIEEEAEFKKHSVSIRTGFDQMIEWTKEGKLWHFPIDNEQGWEERDVGFHEHIFLDDHIQDFPQTGPIRHFMELVTVGLSKNPHLTVEEKKEHIDWFRQYFMGKQKILKEALGNDGIIGDNETDQAEAEAEA